MYNALFHVVPKHFEKGQFLTIICNEEQVGPNKEYNYVFGYDILYGWEIRSVSIKLGEESKLCILFNKQHCYKKKKSGQDRKTSYIEACIPSDNNVWSRKLDTQAHNIKRNADFLREFWQKE